MAGFMISDMGLPQRLFRLVRQSQHELYERMGDIDTIDVVNHQQ